jgi:hypothetical protein
VREADRYSPQAPTHIARRFDLEREIPVPRFQAMLEEILSSPLLPRLARIVERRLGRKLEPHDLWFNGFRPRSGHREADLDAAVKQRYPDVAAFQADLPRILGVLGFSPERSRELASRIVVEPSRGAGQAVPTARREDRVRLHTRIGAGGMNYKGFNIALHELGHNVEMVFSLWHVDSPLLQGVPNTGFTEAIAFLFQYRDLEVLGFPKAGPETKRYHVMNELWSAMEIAGVGLLDLRVWQWMYAHPRATPAQLREAVIQLSRDVWNRYFAPVLGHRDVTLLGIYSHLISNLLYLPDYALGQIVAFQIAEHLERGGAFATEVERVTRLGRLTPDLWMKHATGSPVRASVLLEAARKAVEAEESTFASPRP